MRIDRRVFETGRARTRIELSLHFNRDILQIDLLVGRLDEVGMRQATRQRAEQQFRRARSEIVSREIGRAVADDLEITDADSPDAAAPLCTGLGLQALRTRLRGAGVSLATQQGFALLCEIFREIG